MHNSSPSVEDWAPQEAGIPGITLALNNESMARVLAPIAADTVGDRRNPGELEITVLRLKRDRRCLLRYDFLTTENGGGVIQSFIGKMRARGADQKTYCLNQALWNGAFGPGATDGIEVPEPVALLTDPAMYLLRTVDAPTLGAELEAPNGEQYCYRAGQALHKLHTQGPTTTRSHGRNDEYRILCKKLQITGRQLPTLAPRLRRVLAACKELLRGLPDAESVMLHRDFYPEQILVDGDRVWLLDLDLYASGDPMLDIGNFVAHLHELSLRKFRHCYAYLSHERAFIDGYRSRSGSRRGSSIATYVTLSLARHIAISQLVAGRAHTTGDLLTVCERRLALQVDGF